MGEFDTFARVYDLDYGDFLDDLPMYLGFAERTGSPILELGCGTGRLLLPMAQAGYSVTGVDSSPTMLAVAESKLDSRTRRRVRLIQSDMVDVDLGRKFKLVTVPVNGLMLVPTLDDQARVLQQAQVHLEDAGLLVIDLFNPDPGEMADSDKQLIHAWTKLDDGGSIVSKFVSQTADFANQLQTVTFFYDETNLKGETKRTVAPFSQRYLFRFEMELLLEKCGFIMENLFGSYDLDDFRSDSEKMIFVARRA